MAVPLPDPDVVPPASEGLVDGCGLGAALVGDPDAGALVAPVPALLVPATGDPGDDGFSDAALPDPAAGTSPVVGTSPVLLAMSGCRICSTCCS